MIESEELQRAREDNVRLASRVRRLEQLLAAERERVTSLAASAAAAVAEETADVRVEQAADAADAWTKTLERCEREATRWRSGDREKEKYEAGDWDALRRFLRQQTLLVETLGRENAQLHDQLQTARVTRHGLLDAQLENEHLRSQVQALRAKQRGQPAQRQESNERRVDTGDDDRLVLEPLVSSTLADRISTDKLLRWLRVETRVLRAPPASEAADAAATPTKKSQLLQRAFLKDASVRCFLTLDRAALRLPGKENVHSSASGAKAGEPQRREALERKVGLLCSEIVATCCHVLQVTDVGSLPRAVQAASRLASTTPTVQRFLKRLQLVVDRVQEPSAFALPRAALSTAAASHQALESLLEQLEDVAAELAARRKQMQQQSPGAGDVFATLFALMRLLRVAHADELQAALQRVLTSARSDRLFALRVRELLGLDRGAASVTVEETIARLTQQLLVQPQPAAA